MKICILSRNRNLYSTRRLIEAAREQGHEVSVIDVLRCYMNIVSNNPSIHYRGETLEGFDAVIPRIGASVTFYGSAVLRQFEMMGVYPLNESVAISRSRDKLRSLQLLARKGIAYVPQGREIFPLLTVQENLEIGLPVRKDKKVPEFIFELFPVLREMLGRRGGDLSGGQQQQLAIGRALVRIPDIGLVNVVAGERVVREASIPSVNTFSFAQPDAPWLLHQWAPGVLLYGAFAWGGVTGVLLLKAALAVSIASMRRVRSSSIARCCASASWRSCSSRASVAAR